jgi:hypothetical protein
VRRGAVPCDQENASSDPLAAECPLAIDGIRNEEKCGDRSVIHLLVAR